MRRRGATAQPVTGPFRRLGGRLTVDAVAVPTPSSCRDVAAQNLALAAVLLALNVLLWTQVSDTGLRLVAAALSVIAWPVLVTLVFDRRSS